MDKTYLAIDLKSFYASVECMERGLDPLTAHLVVADASRTEKTICLAVSPAMKAYGIPGRARLFEVVQRVKEINATRSPEDQLTYIAATPRMALYMEYSTWVYNVYLKFFAPEDIHVYSVDEVMIDATNYLHTYEMNGKELTSAVIQEISKETGLTATGGVGTNLYLCKVAMDIMAKHCEPDEHGVRIAELNELSYREQLWSHTPLTDFWRVGRGYAKKLNENAIYTMGDVARCSMGGPSDYYNEDLLYRLFGVNAELLIDHAWGWEPCTIAEIKAYKPEQNSVGVGQVLSSPYPHEKARLIAHEMIDLLVLDLVEKGLVTDQIVITVGYDIENLKDPGIRNQYHGPITTDPYGRQLPKNAHGSINMDKPNSSTKKITEATMALFDRITNPLLLVRRVYLTCAHVVPEETVKEEQCYEQLTLFTDVEAQDAQREQEALEDRKEKQIQKAVLAIKNKYGKNAIVKGMNLEEGATTMDRNRQVGGHKA